MALAPTFASDEELSSTLISRTEKLVEQNEYPLPFWENQERIHGKSGPQRAGTPWLIELNFGRHSEIQQLTTGYEPLDWTVEDIGTDGQALPGYWLQPVAISNRDRKINDSAKVFSRLERRTEVAFIAMRERTHKKIFGLSGLAGVSDLNTFNGDDYGTGFFESAAPGAQGNEVHGIDKSNYLDSLGWQNQFGDVGGAFSTDGLSVLTTATLEAKSLNRPSKGNVWYASTSGYANLRRALRTNEQYVDQKSLDGGRMAMTWDGEMIELCRDMPGSGTVTGVADQEWSFLRINHDCAKFEVQKGAEYFKAGEMKTRDGYDVTAGAIFLMGQLTVDYMGDTILIRGADGW